MALTDMQIKREKPGEGPKKLRDGGGLYLLVTVAGGKLWRWDYRDAGRKEKTMTLG